MAPSNVSVDGLRRVFECYDIVSSWSGYAADWWVSEIFFEKIVGKSDVWSNNAVFRFFGKIAKCVKFSRKSTSAYAKEIRDLADKMDAINQKVLGNVSRPKANCHVCNKHDFSDKMLLCDNSPHYACAGCTISFKSQVYTSVRMQRKNRLQKCQEKWPLVRLTLDRLTQLGVDAIYASREWKLWRIVFAIVLISSALPIRTSTATSRSAKPIHRIKNQNFAFLVNNICYLCNKINTFVLLRTKKNIKN